MKLLLRILGLVFAPLLLPLLARADGLEDILARKVVRIGVCEFAPWTFTNKGGQLEGFDIDLGRQIAHDLGVTADFKVYSLDAAFAAIERGEVDFLAAGLAITPARALRVEFSSPYFESGTTIVTHRQRAPGVRHAEDLNRKGFVVLAVADTFSSGLAAELYDVAAIKIVPDAPAAEAELLAGRAHGYLTSMPDAAILARLHPATLELPLAKPLIKSVAGFGVKRGNQAVLNYLNAWIAARWADNLLPARYNYWFSGYEWTNHLKETAVSP